MRYLIVGMLVLSLAACGDAIKKTDNETSIHEQVMARGTIRCGWAEFPPYFIRNADGTFSGLVHDLVQEIGKRTSLKPEFVMQVGWGSVVDDLVNRKIDMACSYFWSNSTRGRLIDFTNPFVYDQLWVYQRADDARTFADYRQLNDPQYTFGAIDGGAENKLIEVRFPNAKKSSLPELSSTGEFIEALAGGKVDFITIDANTAGRYMDANPGKIKRLDLPQPVHVFPGVMLLPPNDPQFKAMIDITLREIDLDGALDAILEKYGMQDKVGRTVYFK